VNQIKETTGGGVDFAFETAGAAPALALAYQITRRGGTTITAGLPNPNHQFSIRKFHYDRRAHAQGILHGIMRAPARYTELPCHVPTRRLPVKRLITHRIKLNEINEGFDLLASGSAGRILMAL